MKKQILWILGVFALIFLLLCMVVAKNNRTMLTAKPSPETLSVIVDAGHGGMDGGAVGVDGTVEKEINLQIAKKVDAMLRFLGYRSVMTRTEDISLHTPDAKTTRQKKVSDIHQRMRMMEETKDAIFVSIHQNQFSDESQTGTQVFYSKNKAASAVLAQSIQDAVVASIQPENTRKIKPSGTEIYLLYHAPIPAVLVECGFLSNYGETQLLKDETYQQKISAAIVAGILAYCNEETV